MATTTDPCQVVTSQEASSLAGASYGAGREETTSGGAKTCTYGYQTLNVFNVVLSIAPDAATAQAQWAQNEAKAKAALAQFTGGGNANVTASDATVAGADKAAIAAGSATLNGRTINISAIYLLKGTAFLSYSDLVLSQPAPTSAAMEAEAVIALGRLP